MACAPVLAASLLGAAAPQAAAIVDVTLPGAGVRLDASIYVPALSPAPAVLLAHGFGGSKADVADQARSLQNDGYLVLAWSARGFGKSTGQISMNAPDAEVADVRRLIDYLGRRDDVQRDGKGDPHVGIAGSSYGGAVALLAAGQDRRVDAVAANITWSDLQQSLFPQSGNVRTPGVLKRAWVGNLFALTGTGVDAASAKASPVSPVCGRLSPRWCALYQDSVVAGAPSPALASLLNQSSPSRWASRITAPTLLMQGEADSLFGLQESTRTAAAIVAGHPGTPVSMVWHAGGHDNAGTESARQQTLVRDWFDVHLRRSAQSFPKFQVTESAGSISLADSAPAPKVFESDMLPMRASMSRYQVRRVTAFVASPIGGQPAAVSALPGIGSASFGGAAATMLLPGQSAMWAGEPLTEPQTIIGAPSISMRVTSSSGDAVLFFSTLIQSPSGGLTQPQGLVAPVRLANIPRQGTILNVQMPAVVAKAAPGDRLVVAVSATDQSYDVPRDARTYSLTPVSALQLPSMALSASAANGSLWLWPGIAAILAVAALTAGWLLRPRKPRTAPETESADASQPALGEMSAATPLVAVRHVVKEYADGFVAVNNLCFDVHRGQVVGLLGPNGAGKTTTLRMLMGLIRPTGGEIDIDGSAVYPGSPALARLGSFVEGPGFMPHLSGAANLDLYWRSTGRADDPQLERALDIAGLGDAVNKKVKSYSHGMKQRLAIAQAMLGMPDLLVLDEPTNGLDPTQIRAMRGVLRDYAATGRTIIVSSHLLAEVQQTCTHVVVMHRGHLVAAGAIEDILHRGAGTNPQLEDVFMALIGSDTLDSPQERQ